MKNVQNFVQIFPIYTNTYKFFLSFIVKSGIKFCSFNIKSSLIQSNCFVLDKKSTHLPLLTLVRTIFRKLMKITLLIEQIYMYTATQASMLHRWKLNLNTCKKCMLRYWKIPLFVCKSHIAQFGKSYLSFLATNFSSTEYSKSSGSSIHRKNVRSTRTYVKKLECDH